MKISDDDITVTRATGKVGPKVKEEDEETLPLDRDRLCGTREHHDRDHAQQAGLERKGSGLSDTWHGSRGL